MSTALPSTEKFPRVLVLWDIDHTLIESRGFGRTSIAAHSEQPLETTPKTTQS